LTQLAELFKCALDMCLPDSVVVLGVAGGNGLEHMDYLVTTRIVGVDINVRYLEKVEQRFGKRVGLELHCHDLAESPLRLAPAPLVHAALVL
jgi:hypothetical protein